MQKTFLAMGILKNKIAHSFSVGGMAWIFLPSQSVFSPANQGRVYFFKSVILPRNVTGTAIWILWWCWLHASTLCESTCLPSPNSAAVMRGRLHWLLGGNQKGENVLGIIGTLLRERGKDVIWSCWVGCPYHFPFLFISIFGVDKYYPYEWQLFCYQLQSVSLWFREKSTPGSCFVQ